ncbi:YdeI/OmpD-associated family protein [Actinocorallia sp. A-T 12471]|uniref:YdeI/OmpD-associated family protein n=1 Tax=Actinocorallia sp. A-T 12471 TaxID=3089813 RepID=UPI0029D21575|nr:YdeI/OmpD-associated family protein [Actinocorallia sp. A-T 12471]MDX6741585.1 YdeI/OmpD-associated family protein [Actinocorallia sp. A-T 12471]
MNFRTTLRLHGKTSTGLVVPEEVVTGLGGGKRPAVNVTINGHTYPSTVGSMGGEFRIPVSAENRALAGIAAGDEVDVEVTLDTAPREIAVPADLAAALAAEPEAKRFFDGLAASHRKAFALAVESAKKPETRAKRVADTVEKLKQGKNR